MLIDLANWWYTIDAWWQGYVVASLATAVFGPIVGKLLGMWWRYMNAEPVFGVQTCDREKKLLAMVKTIRDAMMRELNEKLPTVPAGCVSTWSATLYTTVKDLYGKEYL